jgi:WD40 repeat protein
MATFLLLLVSSIVFTYHPLVAQSFFFFSESAADKTVKLWSTSGWSLKQTLSGSHERGLSDIAWSPDGRYVATASDDTTIGIWDVESVGFCFPYYSTG